MPAQAEFSAAVNERMCHLMSAGKGQTGTTVEHRGYRISTAGAVTMRKIAA